MAIGLSKRARLTQREFEVMSGELGNRVMEYLVIENSDWAYKMWFASCRYWWNAATSSFVEETRPHMLRFAEVKERKWTAKKLSPSASD